jgi:arabinosaccharide transport system substrate-binding protein
MRSRDSSSSRRHWGSSTQFTERIRRHRKYTKASASPGALVILLLFLGTLPFVLLRPGLETHALGLWVFSPTHAKAYEPLLGDWNRSHPGESVDMQVLDTMALERRMLSGFQAGTPVADLIEVERALVGRVFAGPLEAIGFADLAPLLDREGLLEKINPPSFSPWTSRGRIFGLPHDVHPVLLAYRSDLVEEADIDLSGVETWADFIEALRPLMADNGLPGHPDRYLLNLWHTQGDVLEALLLQAGGGLFNAHDEIDLLQEPNVRTLATIATWLGGPGRIAVDAPRFSAAGNQLVLDGTVLATIMPDWLAGSWIKDLPSLSGRVKLMPLPAWQPGGRRTSVMGGTMLGITRASTHFETAWNFARELYLSTRLAEDLFRENHIISPVVAHWELPFYHQPTPFFGGQHSGALYIEAAPSVPRRSSSPFNAMALQELCNVVRDLHHEAQKQAVADLSTLEPQARELLERAQARIRRQVERNVFLRQEAAPAP